MPARKEDHSKYRGLRGIWTRYTEKSELTGHSYAEGSAAACILTSGATFTVGAISYSTFLIVQLAMEGGEFSDRKFIVANLQDNAFHYDHQHIGIALHDGGHFYLVQDESAWRLYTVEGELDGPRTMTYVQNPDHVLDYLEIIQMQLQREYQDLSSGLFHEPSHIYQSHSVSGVYEDNGQIQRFARMRHSRSNGGSLEDVYNEGLTPVGTAIAQMRDTSDGIEYGFVEDSTPVTYIQDDPIIDFQDAAKESFEVLKEFMPAALGILLPSLLGAAGIDEYANRRRKRKDQEKAKTKPSVKHP